MNTKQPSRIGTETLKLTLVKRVCNREGVKLDADNGKNCYMCPFKPNGSTVCPHLKKTVSAFKPKKTPKSLRKHTPDPRLLPEKPEKFHKDTVIELGQNPVKLQLAYYYLKPTPNPTIIAHTENGVIHGSDTVKFTPARRIPQQVEKVTIKRSKKGRIQVTITTTTTQQLQHLRTLHRRRISQQVKATELPPSPLVTRKHRRT